MTTIDHPLRPSLDAPSAPAPTSPAARRLRRVLAANAVSSATFGIVGLAWAGYWSDRLGIDHVGLTVAVAIGLIAFAADVGWVARGGVDRLRRFTPLVTVADATWVVASIAAVALGVLSTVGAIAAVVVAVGVADLALAQAWLLRRLPSTLVHSA